MAPFPIFSSSLRTFRFRTGLFVSFQTRKTTSHITMSDQVVQPASEAPKVEVNKPSKPSRGYSTLTSILDPAPVPSRYDILISRPYSFVVSISMSASRDAWPFATTAASAFNRTNSESCWKRNLTRSVTTGSSRAAVCTWPRGS